MSLRYLLDTNALSEPLKPQPSALFVRKFRANRDRMAIAATTWHEALFGMHRMPAGKRKQTIHDYLFDVIAATLPVLPFDAAAAEWHAIERARLAARGKVLPFADGQIASIAKTKGLTVVTANGKDFEPFADIETENWAG